MSKAHGTGIQACAQKDHLGTPTVRNSPMTQTLINKRSTNREPKQEIRLKFKYLLSDFHAGFAHKLRSPRVITQSLFGSHGPQTSDQKRRLAWKSFLHPFSFARLSEKQIEIRP
jgi:hypothetical protein